MKKFIIRTVINIIITTVTISTNGNSVVIVNITGTMINMIIIIATLMISL